MNKFSVFMTKKEKVSKCGSTILKIKTKYQNELFDKYLS